MNKIKKKGKKDKYTEKDKSLAFQYAWNWFDYHARQRLTTFNFFLIIIGALAYGYIRVLPINDMKWLAAWIGLFAFIVSIAFLCIEVRNTILVDDGRQALDKLEKNSECIKSTISIPIFKKLAIRERDCSRKKEKNVMKKVIYYCFRHTFCFRCIISFSAALALFASFAAPKPIVRNPFPIGFWLIISIVVFVTFFYLFVNINDWIKKNGASS